MKTCSKCKTEKALDDFSLRSDGSGKPRAACKECASRSARDYHREHRDERLAYAAEYRRNNPDYFAAKRREHYDRDASKAKTYAWRAANPERYREHVRVSGSSYRARLRDAFVEAVEPSVVLEAHGGVCGICGDPITGQYDVDHVIPLAKGGLHSYANVQPAHPVCNRRKRDRMPEEAIA